MLKNNLKTLFIYFLFILITLGLLIFINYLYRNTDVRFSGFVFSVLMVTLYVISLLCLAKIIGVGESYRYDFFNFLLVTVIGIFLYFLAELGGGVGRNIKINLLNIFGSIYLSPYIMITEILGYKFSIIWLVLISFVSSMIVGLSLRRIRVKLKRKNRKTQ